MSQSLLESLALKMQILNKHSIAVIFIITGVNGSGKTVFTKRLLTELPFHQTFNLGAVAKTVRFAYRDQEVTRLENFTDKKTTALFTPIVQFSCAEYRKNGVNVIIDGVQIDTLSSQWEGLITGGIILRVSDGLRLERNQYPDTHFNRAMELTITDHMHYTPSKLFIELDNNKAKEETFQDILMSLSKLLDSQLERLDINNQASAYTVRNSKNHDFLRASSST